jgi:hypothetical protein
MRDVRESVIEYGIQTPTSRQILVITEDLHDAEHMLDLLGDGRLLTRTVTYGAWRPVDADAVRPA